MKLRDFFPQSLMGRSLLILVIPVVMAQIIAVTVFWDNHWDKMTRRLAYSVTGEIAITADQLQNHFTPERYERLGDYLSQYLGLRIYFEADKSLPPQTQDFSYIDMLIVRPFLRTLEEQLDSPYQVVLDHETKQLVILIQLENGLLRVFVPQRRLFSTSGYVFVLLLVGSSFSLLLISIIFLRNQIRPIRKLAVAATRMGKGRHVSLGKPSGAREVRQATEAFENMQRRIRRQIEQRTAMLAGVSHDLRTPLTRIKLGLSLLENQRDAADMMADVEEMERMVNAYLEFARGEKIEEAVMVDMMAFLSEILSSYQTEKIDVALETNVPKVMVAVQRINFRRCLENILSNASRYATKIAIHLDLQDDRLGIIVEDNGPGIPADQYDDVFKPFVTLDPSRSKETGGVGLGMAVVMDIVLAHGGKIKLGRGETLKGLQVSICIPT